MRFRPCPSLLISVLLAPFLSMAEPSSAAESEADISPLTGGTGVVHEIIWSGLEHLSESELESGILTTRKSWKPWAENRPFDAGTLEQDLKRIARLYRRHGFYDTRIESQVEPVEGGVVLRLTLDEGPQVVVEEFGIVLEHLGLPGAPIDSAELERDLPLREAKGFGADEYERAKILIQERLARRGYPASSVAGGAEVDLDRHRVRVQWRVAPGPFVRMGRPVVTGLEKVAPQLVLGELGWSVGETYNPLVLRRTQRAIFDLGLFRAVTIEPIRSNASTQGKAESASGNGPGEAGGDAWVREEIWPMEIRVRERPPRSIRASVGYGTDDQFRTRLEWKHRNFLGGLRNLRLGGKYSFLVRGVEAVFVQPRFIVRENKLTLDTVFNEQTEPAFDTRGVSAGWLLERPIAGNWTGRVGQRFEFRKVTQVSATASIVEDDENQSFRLILFEVGARYSSLDSEIDPTWGTWIDLAFEPTFRDLGSDVDYVKGIVELRHFLPMFEKLVLASRIRAGALEPILGDNAANVPVFKRLFAGGSTSVRGFDLDALGPLGADEDPLGGLTLAEASLELRFPIWRSLGGVVFGDAGQVALDSFELRRDDFFYSAGAGLRYKTPIGPLRLDFARVLNAPDGLADFRVHFSIGQAF